MNQYSPYGYQQPQPAQGGYSPPPSAAPDYPQNPHQYRPTQSMLKGRQVSGIDEAKAASIDFDGSPHVFIDISGSRIYVKQLNNQGTLDFNVFALVQDPPAAALQTGQGMSAELAAVTARLLEIEQRIQQCEGMIHNGVQPESTAGTTPKQRKSGGTAQSSGGE